LAPCKDAGGGDPFLTALDIIKLINLIADPERLKRKPAVKCTRLMSGDREEETEPGQRGNKISEGLKGKTCVCINSSEEH